MANNPYKPKKKKKFSIDTKNMGVNIDKNEYYEIILSNTARPDAIFSVTKLKNSSSK